MYGLHESSFWMFPLPFAGDLGVTCLVQGLATYLIVPSLVLLDVRGKRATGLSEPWPRPLEPESKAGSVVNTVGSWVLEDQGGQGVLLIPWDLLVAWRAGELKGLKAGSVAKRIGLRVAGQVIKGALWGAALFFLFWWVKKASMAYPCSQKADDACHIQPICLFRPPSVAILAPFYTHHPMTAPEPEVRILGCPPVLILVCPG